MSEAKGGKEGRTNGRKERQEKSPRERKAYTTQRKGKATNIHTVHTPFPRHTQTAPTCRSHAHLPLLDKGNGLLQRLRHLHPHHHHRQPPPTEGRRSKGLALGEGLLGGD